jgi:hypothetical protein
MVTVTAGGAGTWTTTGGGTGTGGGVTIITGGPARAAMVARPRMAVAQAIFWLVFIVIVFIGN